MDINSTNAAEMTERLIDAAIYYEQCGLPYRDGARKELNEARAAIEIALATPSPAPVSASSPAGGVREALEIARKLEDIADASMRIDGTDIPLGETVREAAREIEWLVKDLARARTCMDRRADRIFDLSDRLNSAREAASLLTEIADEFGGSIQQYDKIGPDWTHKDGTEVFNVSALLDRRELIYRARALAATLSSPATPEPKNWRMGEPVNPKHLTNMKWVPYEEALRYLHVNTFLGRWREYDEQGQERADRDRIAFCCQDDHGDVLSLGSDGGELSSPSWRGVDAPDEILVATPDPVSAPANGEVVERAEIKRISDWLLERNHDHLLAAQENRITMMRVRSDTEMFLDAAILLSKLAILSNPAPGHGEGE